MQRRGPYWEIAIRPLESIEDAQRDKTQVDYIVYFVLLAPHN